MLLANLLIPRHMSVAGLGESPELGVVSCRYPRIWGLFSGVWLELNNAAANANGDRLGSVAGA